MKISSIVEGDGEVAALPILLRRLAIWRTPEIHPEIKTPIRVRRDKFLNREDEFRRHLLLAASKCDHDGWILILLDADDDCPAELGKEILARAKAHVTQNISVILANREYEAWFIAAAQSLDGFRGFKWSPRDEKTQAENPRNAKGWIKERMATLSYGTTTDQPAFTARIDLQLAFNRSRSFRKLCKEWDLNIL